MEWFKVYKGAIEHRDTRAGMFIIGECVDAFHAETLGDVKQFLIKRYGEGEWVDNRVYKTKDGTEYNIVPCFDKTMKKNEKKEYKK